MSKSLGSASKVASGARSVTVAVIISRLLGLIREQVLAGFFGASWQMDAFVVAYRIPNLLRDLFAEGALGMAFTKVFSSYQELYGRKKAFEVASEALTSLGLLILGLVVVGEILAPGLVKLLAPEFKSVPGKFELTVTLTRIMWPFLFFISLAAILAGMLNSLGVFFWPALSSALFNLFTILGGVSLYFLFRAVGQPEILGMGLAVLGGGLLQAAFQGPFLKRRGFSFAFRLRPQSPALKEIFLLMGPAVLGLSAVQINVFINTYFATSCGPGAVSWLAYAFRLMYVPLGLFGVGLSLALLPETSRQAARRDFKALKHTYISSLLVGLSLSLPSAVGLALLARPIVALIFEHGKFSPQDTLNTAQALFFFALGLPSYSVSKATVPVFYALGHTLIPALGSFLAVGINVLFVVLTLPYLNFKAIALGTSLGLLGQSIFLLGLFSYKIRGLPFKIFFFRLFKLVLEAGLMGGIALLGREWVPVYLLIPLCALFYLALIKLWGPEEGLLFWKRRRSQ